MKNKYVCIFVLLLCAVSTIVAQNAKVKEPGKKQVLLVGRVSLLQDIDRDFYIKTLDLNPELRDAPHRYGFLTSPNAQIPSVPIDSVIGDYFFIPIKIPKDGRFSLKGFFVFLFTPESNKLTKGNIFYERARHIYLPFGMDVQVSPENRYVYIGSYTYSFAGDNFMVDGVQRRDEFDEAQDILNARLGKEVQLTRAVLTDPEEKEKK
ncbi:hypothetical protein V1L52_00680 [Treponema sp. HNW]|uniref:hypothetical protein n=1 Tax=Treponema sp. HNW TaxID=3116654 RepID=UPI003D0A56B6